MWIAWIGRVVDANGVEKDEPCGINPEKVICLRRTMFAAADGGKKIGCTEIICDEKIHCRTLLSLEEVAERLSARAARAGSGRIPGKPDYSGVRFSSERQG